MATAALTPEAAEDALLFPPVSPLPTPAPRAAELEEAERILDRAERAIEAHDYGTALELLDEAAPLVRARPELELRALLAEAWGRTAIGEVGAALGLLERARALSDDRPFTDADRARVLFRLGCCRLKLSAVANALELFTVALDLCDRSGLPCDRLRAEILDWRTRCYRRQRDWEAAQRDAESAIELAESVGDSRLIASTYLQASLVGERRGQLFVAQCYAERARELFLEVGDDLAAGKVLNNLGGIYFLLDRPEDAKAALTESFRIALDRGDDVDAAYAVSSTAQVFLHTGDFAEAEAKARYALELLADRNDHVNELGSAQLVLGRALLEQERFDEADAALRAADDSFARMDSDGHRSAARLARGDVAAKRGDATAAAALYRSAAEVLQDVRF